MGGGGAKSLSARLSVDKLARRSWFEEDAIGGRTVGDVLDEAESDGSIVYEASRTSKNIQRDLFAHAALYLDGRSFTVLEEVTSNETGKKGGTNVDLLMHDGVYWEIKSPTADGKSKDPLHFVKTNLERAEDNFKGDPRTKATQTRVIFNCRHTTIPDDLIEGRIATELTRHPNIKAVLVVRKDGSIKPIL